MKNPTLFRVFLVFVISCGVVGCQSKPKGRPLSEMSDAELLEYYKNAPVDNSGKKTGGWTPGGSSGEEGLRNIWRNLGARDQNGN